MTLYHVTSFDETLMHCRSYVAHKNILSIVPLILLVVGTFGNLMSIYVLLHRAFRHQSIYTYLIVVSVADTAVLYIGLLPIWLDNLIGFRPKEQVTWVCKLTAVGHVTASQFSVWLIVAVTVERFIATTQSFNALSLCTNAKAKVIIGLLLVLLFGLNSHMLHTVTIIEVPGNTNRTDDFTLICSSKPKFDFLVNTVWPWVDTCFYSLIPFVIIITLNIIMIVSVRNSTQQRNSLIRRRDNATRHSHDTKLTMMLLSISIVFILTTIPVNVIWIARIFIAQMDGINTCQVCTFKLCHTISEMLMYTNHSINFFLYLLSGKKFRHYLVERVCPAGTKFERFLSSYRSRSLISHTYVVNKSSTETRM